MAPREFARRVTVNHGIDADPAVPFVGLDEAYDLLDHTECTATELDAEVIDEGRRIAARPHGTTDPSG
ncbi:hypothetical protein [Actinopolyspora mortivallis]|uniref:Uncharacterized protein n=1 Tax=Actinopolyspora mortivallis TaxID=33906 RepID=A0A2T0GSD5_ACTMO|nr:hypothetical protein [Actinopolyspora mortivallis]PRW62032.1 hypothetical protein CEP50_17475 [Actinopolyspora mortivallis]